MEDKPADYYQKLEEDKVECFLCPHNCKIPPGETGICGVRTNRKGTLYSDNYGRVSSAGVDPIEKKPLYHFYPGSGILSLGTYGCNLGCSFCQNWRISQQKPRLQQLSPRESIRAARRENTIGIAYTYSEPSVWCEYVRDTSRLAREKGLKNVLVTNGYITEKPLQELLPSIDAANIDLKAINDDFYKQYCGGRLEPVLDTIRLMEENIHVEITVLLIGGLNDSEEEMEQLFGWIGDLNPAIPLHISRYFPNYKMEKPPTPVSKMKEAYELAGERLENVYLGNIRVKGASNTYCSECGREVIVRSGYSTSSRLQEGKCPECGKKIYGVFGE